MSSSIHTILKDRFGLDQFRPGQKQVIEAILDGRSAIAIFPTGGGKSLCYQLPSLLLPGLTIVVSPLMALMKDQVDQLLARGIPAVRLDSSLDKNESNQALQQIESGATKILYVSPERFFNETFRRQVSQWKISLFAIDEAHCISQWGHAFRPDYLKLAEIVRQIDVKSVLALTATATLEVEEDIRKQFGIAKEDSVRTPFYRSNLALSFFGCVTAKERDRLLLNSLKKDPLAPRIIYVTYQKTSEEVANWLVTNGLTAAAYHAGLDNEVRTEIQRQFMSNEIPIVVATIAFGMGVDKSNIRYVSHYNPPKSLESYAQEIGRAGRDNEPAVCESFIYEPDRVALENFSYGDTPSLEDLIGLLDLFAHQPKEFYISYYSIAYQFDVRDIVVRSVLSYLELEGYLEATSSRYDNYDFKPLCSNEKILRNSTAEDRRFSIELMSMAVKKKIWHEIKIIPAMMRLKCDRATIVDRIDRFARNGWWEVKPSGLVHGYRLLKQIEKVETIAMILMQQLERREKIEISRVQQVFDLASSNQCQYKVLSAHFGDTLGEPCGKCSACIKENVQFNEHSTVGRLGDSAIRYLKDAIAKKPDRLSSVRQRARFLCGISSPGFVVGRVSKLEGFGCCSELSFHDVIQGVETAL